MTQPTRRRARETGSITPRGEGVWQVQWSPGVDPVTGKRRRKSATVRGSRTEAERELRRRLGELDAGIDVEPGRLDLAGLEHRHFLPHAKTRLRRRTWNRYAELLEHHVLPAIGSVPLPKLRPSHVQTVIDRMVAAGLADRTIIQTFRVLSSSLEQAVRWQFIGVNPARAVRPPRARRPELTVPDPALIGKLLEVVRGNYLLEGPVLFAATTGARLGEVLAVRHSAVELDEGVVRIVSTLEYEPEGGFAFLDPKTPRARRTVALPPAAVAWLRQHRRGQAERRLALGAAWQDYGVVFDAGDGRPLIPESVGAAFRRVVREAGLPRVRFHDLRHAYATTLMRAGVHPKVASEALGHSSVAFTMDTYQHVLPSMGSVAADAIQAALGDVIGGER